MTRTITEFEKRLEAVEAKQIELAQEFEVFKNGINEKLDTITVFVTGANTVFGLARKHWSKIIVFGAGLMTAAGVGNPKVNAFLTTFFGG